MTRMCPICRQPAVREHAPFCSRACRAIDLNRWLSERYVIEGSDEDAPEGPAPPQSAPRSGNGHEDS